MQINFTGMLKIPRNLVEKGLDSVNSLFGFIFNIVFFLLYPVKSTSSFGSNTKPGGRNMAEFFRG